MNDHEYSRTRVWDLAKKIFVSSNFFQIYHAHTYWLETYSCTYWGKNWSYVASIKIKENVLSTMQILVLVLYLRHFVIFAQITYFCIYICFKLLHSHNCICSLHAWFLLYFLSSIVFKFIVQSGKEVPMFWSKTYETKYFFSKLSNEMHIWMNLYFGFNM
jgi:hypothetical protein